MQNLQQVIAGLGMGDYTQLEQLSRDHSKPESENLEAPG